MLGITPFTDPCGPRHRPSCLEHNQCTGSGRAFRQSQILYVSSPPVTMYIPKGHVIRRAFVDIVSALVLGPKTTGVGEIIAHRNLINLKGWGPWVTSVMPGYPWLLRLKTCTQRTSKARRNTWRSFMVVELGPRQNFVF